MEPTTPGMDLRERRLRADLEAAGRLGSPLELHSSPYGTDSDGISRAIMAGAPRYATRRRRIEHWIDRLLAEAAAVWAELAEPAERTQATFERRWLAWLERQDLTTLNRLIEANNRYYPIEARLPVDPRTGSYITFDGQDYRYDRVDRAWLLARFPTTLAAARRAGDHKRPGGRMTAGLDRGRVLEKAD